MRKFWNGKIKKLRFMKKKQKEELLHFLQMTRQRNKVLYCSIKTEKKSIGTIAVNVIIR